MRIPTTLQDVVNVLALIFSDSLVVEEPTHELSEMPLSSAGRNIPGGSPLSLCEISRPTDIFQFNKLWLSKEPIYIDDMFMFQYDGVFQRDITGNATVCLVTDPPDDSLCWSFSDSTMLNQPLGKKIEWPPRKGRAYVQTVGYIMPMDLNVPGIYNLSFDVKTEDSKERIFCVTARACLRWEDEEKNRWYRNRDANCSWPANMPTDNEPEALFLQSNQG